MSINKKIRIFAGPNGSGKSTLFQEVKSYFSQIPFINADELEIKLALTGYIDLQLYGITATENDLEKFKKTADAKSLISKANENKHAINLQVIENCLVDKSNKTHSYEASFVAAFIRSMLLKTGKSFSYETVMSHSSKIKELKVAQKNGYKTYLYFVCTDAPEINIERVKDRINKGGHKVNIDKIKSRYPQTLKNLYPALKYCDRAFLFDNSGKEHELIAEMSNGRLQLKVNNPPNWFKSSVLKFLVS
ncbi:MAG: zeta toxin family protein [Bacteroidota bacterium]|jgi:predicted ABC-type ATPase